MNPITRMIKRDIKTPLKYALPLLCIGALVLVSISGCTSPANTSPSPSASSAPTPTPTATPTAAPTVTPTPTAKPTAAPVVSTDSNIAGLEDHWLGKGYVITTHFIKTIVDGRTAYKGTVTDSVGTYKVTDILTSTETEAVSYADTLLSQYTTNGFTVSSDNGNHQYVVQKGSTTVNIYAYSEIYGANSPGVGILDRTV